MLKSLSEKQSHDKLADVWSEVSLATGAFMEAEELIDAQLQMLHKFILSSPKFSTLTHKEIIHAFYLNAAGEFAQWTPKDCGGIFPHFSRPINAEWVGLVLGAYVKFKVRMYQIAGDQIRKAIAPPAPVPKRVPMPAAWYMQTVQRHYDLYRAGRNEWDYGWSLIYNFLRKCNMITCESRQVWWNRWDQGVLKLWQETGADDLYQLLAGNYEQMPMYRRREVRRAATFKGQYFALRELFAEFNALGINNIFSEVQYRIVLNQA